MKILLLTLMFWTMVAGKEDVTATLSPYSDQSVAGKVEGFSNQLNPGQFKPDIGYEDNRRVGDDQVVSGPSYDDHYSYYSSAKDSYGGSFVGGGYNDNSGGYGDYGGYENDGYGNDNNQHNNEGYGDMKHHEGYESSKPLRSPFKGLLRAGALLLPILIILGLGLFFPSVVNVTVRRKRDTNGGHFQSDPAKFMDADTMVYATKMLMRAANEDTCLDYIACKLGEKSEQFPLRARVISLMQSFLPDDLNDYFKTFMKASRSQRCTMKFPKKCQ